MKAFLSHSSADKKSYVQIVARNLGKDDIVYDEFSFEEGEVTLAEILNGISESSIFVVFLSDASLESSWVKEELFEARKQLDEGLLAKIYPIIIDRGISYTDSRIPSWLRDNYNLKLVSRPAVAARRIHQKLRELSWKKHPTLRKRNTVFVGRNLKLEEFEQRVDDFDRPKPIGVVASGLPGIGRRTFLREALQKTNILGRSARPSSIYMDRNDSIEDFIL